MLVALAVKLVEVRSPVLAADDNLTVDSDRAHLEPHRGVHDERKAVAPVVAAACVEPDPIAVAPDDQPKAIVLEFVAPSSVRLELSSMSRKARRMNILLDYRTPEKAQCSLNPPRRRAVAGVRRLYFSSKGHTPWPKLMFSSFCRELFLIGDECLAPVRWLAQAVW